MPAIRAISESSLLALTLLVTRIRADYEHDAAPPDNPAAVAHGLYGRSYFHRLALATYPIVLRGGPSGSMNRAAGTQKRPEARTGSIAPGVVSAIALRRLRVPHDDPHDCHEKARQRHLDQRLGERYLKEALAHHRDDDELAAHDRVRDRERRMDVRDQERKRVRGAADEGRDAGDQTALKRAATARDRAVVGESLGDAHADRGAEAGGQADEQSSARA